MKTELQAWLGPTFLQTFEAVPTGQNDRMATALRHRSSRLVWRFSGSDAERNKKNATRLDDYARLLAKRPILKHQALRPVGSIRVDFERALLAKDAASAEARIAELKATGRLNEENLRYLDVRLSAGLGLWPQIARDHWLIQTMSDLALPPQTLSDIIEALYRTYIDDVEASGDPTATLEAFRLHIAKRYSKLFSSRRGIRMPRVVKAFLLFEQLQSSPSKAILAELGGMLNAAQLKNILVETDTDQAQNKRNIEVEADEAFDDLQYDRAFSFYCELPVSKKVISRLLHCADAIGTVDAKSRFLLHIDVVDPSLIADLAPSISNKIRELRNTPINSSSVDDDSTATSQTNRERTPTNWMDWAEQLTHGENLVGAETAVLDAPTNWDIKEFIADEVLSSTFSDLVGNLSGCAELIARKSVPKIFASFYSQEKKPAPETNPVAQLLFDLIAMSDGLANDDLELLSQLIGHRLSFGLSSEDYVSLVRDIGDVQDRIQSYAYLPWSLDICETLAVAPAQSEVEREARLALFVKILGQVQAFAHRLGPQDLLPLEFLAKDFGVDLGAITALQDEEAPNGTENILPDLKGKLIGIYTLAETAGGRAKASLKKMFPECKVEINSDHVATERLKTLAQNADLFVFAWKSSSHAAFYCIKDAIPGGEPVWAQGKGTSSILRAVLDNIQ